MITSSENQKLKTVARLRRRRGREKLGLFLTEGEDLLAAGLASGAEPEFALVRAGSDLPGEEVEPGVLDAAAALESGTRAIAAWPLRWSEDREGACVLLDGLSDPGNTGTIIRTVDSLLEATILIAPGGADPFSPSAVRASMGSVFTQAIAVGTAEDGPAPRIALVPEGGVAPEPVAPPFTLCVGSEREGLGSGTLNLCDERWTIPMRGGGPGSLNAAAAAAIACERIASRADQAKGAKR